MRRICTLAVVACLMMPMTARAERRQRPGASELIEAVAFIRDGRCDAAIPLLRRAHDIGDLRNALWNLGECYGLLSRPRLAIEAYRAYIDHSRTSPHDCTEAEAAIERLEASMARIDVAGNVQGASVRVDGMEEGEIPTTVEVGPGRHVVEIASPGFATFRQEIDANAGDAVRVEAALELLPGEVSVSSTPPGAQVWVDGHHRGATPWGDDGIPAGGLTVEVRLEGYRSALQQVSIRPGQRAALDFDLLPVSGILAVATNAPGATLLIDGRESGQSPFPPLALPPGHHRLEIQAEDHGGWSDEVDILDGRTTRVELELQSTHGLHQAWFWSVAALAITSIGGALVAVGVANGYLTGEFETVATAIESDRSNPLQLATTRAEGERVLGTYEDWLGVGLFLGLTGILAVVTDFFIGLFTRWRTSEGQSEVTIEDEESDESDGIVSPTPAALAGGGAS